ncbi:MAG TPA: CvpA family protein [Hyphomonadaceae bacterium]|nr:CvpA family protein [Hyphomonadaceae bacterium]
MTPLVFDIIVGAVIVVSAVMSLGRGLVREAFSVVSFVIGAIAAILCLRFGEEPLKNMISPKEPSMIPAIILVVVGFLVAYILAAVIGGRLSKLIHASPEIGVLDRLAGGAFGIARGALGMILFVLLVQQVLPDSTPDYISKSQSYAVLNPAASWIRQTVPGFVKCADAVANGSTECVKNQKSGQ